MEYVCLHAHTHNLKMPLALVQTAEGLVRQAAYGLKIEIYVKTYCAASAQNSMELLALHAPVLPLLIPRTEMYVREFLLILIPLRTPVFNEIPRIVSHVQLRLITVIRVLVRISKLLLKMTFAHLSVPLDIHKM
jgi:hypothetical protein